MGIVKQYRKVSFTILEVDSIPCSLVGKKMVFSDSGKIETQPWKLPWPMPWIERELKKLATEKAGVSGVETKRVYNPEELDQYVLVRIERYIDLTVGQIVDLVADRYSDKEALINHDGSVRYKYNKFQKLCQNLANGLLCIGVRKDDKTAIWSSNSPEAVIAQFGTSKAGSVMVPINPHEKQMGIEVLLEQSDATTLIMNPGVKGTENIEMLYNICPELKTCKPGALLSVKLPMLKNVIVVGKKSYPGTYSWSQVIDMGQKEDDGALIERSQQLHYDDPIHMIYTSGSTGTPKGVLLSHGNIIENALAMVERMKLTPQDKMCIQAPIFHCFGCVACTLTSVISGCSMVMIKKFCSYLTMKIIERERCTVASGVPTMFLSFLDEIRKEKFDISSLRTGIIAGAACTKELVCGVVEVLGMKDIVISYGLTECSPCITATKAEDALEQKANTVGYPIPGVEIKIVNPLTNEPVKPGEQGEIYTRGYNVMKGYYNNLEETEKVLDQDGWLHTGDIGILREDGYLEVLCRCKDVIIRGGENISPKEIEAYIGTLADVYEVYIVGVADSFYGEEMMAFIRLHTGSTLSELDIKSYCKGRLASNKIPKYITFVETFPLSSTGKVLKSELSRMALAITKELDKKTS
ncbi:AMP-binding protein [Clostridiaceae bacterium 35-E11]